MTRRGRSRSRCAAVFGLLCSVGVSSPARAQSVQEVPDSTALPGVTLGQDGLYDRPFLGSLGGTSIGGYLEGNTNYFREEGVTQGFSMELRRFNIFLFSAIGPRIRFLSELEFEHGTEEIALETAQLDVRLSPALSLRAGIILPPLGYLNQNHDSPKWDFVERPLVSTDVIPSTLSEVGAGVLGSVRSGRWTVSYDAYLTNGLQDGIVDNSFGRTDIASGRSDEAFGEDNNGSPALTGRVAVHLVGWGEVGVSGYSGAYNSYRLEGEEVDEPRGLEIVALDVQGDLAGFDVRGELARAWIETPDGLGPTFGEGQWGAHLDLTRRVWSPSLAGYENAALLVGLRLEQVDYNTGSFPSTGRAIRDDVRAVVATASLRPSASTAFRFNYRFQWTRDAQGNPASRGAGVQLGFATYF